MRAYIGITAEQATEYLNNLKTVAAAAAWDGNNPLFRKTTPTELLRYCIAAGMDASACTGPELAVRVLAFLRKDFEFNIPGAFKPLQKFVDHLGKAYHALHANMASKAATQLASAAVAAAAEHLGQRCAGAAGREIAPQQLHGEPWPRHVAALFQELAFYHVNDRTLGTSFMLTSGRQTVTLPGNKATYVQHATRDVQTYLHRSWANVAALTPSGPGLIPQSAFAPADNAFASFFPVDDFLLVLLERFRAHNADAAAIPHAHEDHARGDRTRMFNHAFIAASKCEWTVPAFVQERLSVVGQSWDVADRALDAAWCEYHDEEEDGAEADEEADEDADGDES